MIFDKRENKLSYQAKDDSICPACTTVFRREELLTGGGRLIAGVITDELHRLYEPSAKYGDVYPLVYQATVCPVCWFASMEKDFYALPADAAEQVNDNREKRMEEVQLLFPDLDFSRNRDLISGTASQYLVMRCYDYFNKDVSPTIKQGIAALRAGWLFDILHEKNQGENYDWLATLLKKKALFFYSEAIRREQNGQETISAIKNCGPDTDKNYAYEGILYLSALLQVKYGQTDDRARRIASLEEAKRTIARMFGVGKTSKEKPGPLLEHARDLYMLINKELNETD
ncbi:MAG: DUF2225 domain-containing protein [Spirochaetaceae bacterium]|jgi:uncharacterized protein (DUF2225 family)|nr:DUF2225 domain-containing protein [Spirochaetaceae bacterium]